MGTETDKVLRPPTDAERGILMYWLDQSKRALDQLEPMDSPYAEYLDDFCGLMADILDPTAVPA